MEKQLKILCDELYRLIENASSNHWKISESWMIEIQQKSLLLIASCLEDALKMYSERMKDMLEEIIANSTNVNQIAFARKFLKHITDIGLSGKGH